MSIQETSSEYQMFTVMGAGPFEDTLWVIRRNVTMEIIHEGDRLYIEYKWSQLHK